MKSLLTLSLLLLGGIARADVPPPPAASQTEVNTGTSANKYVSPKTLASWAGPGGNGVATTTYVKAATNVVNGTISFTTISIHAQSGHGIPAVEWINNNLATYSWPSNNVDSVVPIYGEIPVAVASSGTNAITRMTFLSTNPVAFPVNFYSFLNQALSFTNDWRWSTTSSDNKSTPYAFIAQPGMNTFWVTNTYSFSTNSNAFSWPVMAWRMWRAADAGGPTNSYPLFWHDTTVYFSP